MPKTLQTPKRVQVPPTCPGAPKRVRVSAKTTCSICLEDRYKRRMTRLECGHHFCKSCIKKWAKHQNTCPQCRKRFTRLGSQTVQETNQQAPQVDMDGEMREMMRQITYDWMFDRDFQNEIVQGLRQRDIASMQVLDIVSQGLQHMLNWTLIQHREQEIINVIVAEMCHVGYLIRQL